MFSYMPHTSVKIILTLELIYYRVLWLDITTEPPLMKAMVELGGIANEQQLVAV